MKNIFSLLMALLLCSGSMAIDVTFRVDMSQQTVSPNGVHIAGSFNSWNPAATLMTNSGNNIYTVVINLTAATVYPYKFINGNAWGTDETVPAACGVPNGSGGYNREVTGPATATVLNAVCFSQCSACGTPVTLTLQVDMSQQTVSPNGVHVAGTFNGWSTVATAMTLSSGSIYVATVTVSTGSVQEYKFINGNAWGPGEEVVPSACGVPNGSGGYNRQVTIAAANMTVPVVCFSQCGPCSSNVNLTLSVDMSQQTVAATGVHVGGAFNNWSSSATVMTAGGNNIYTAIVSVPGGSVQEYKFINGDAWTGEEIVPSACGVPNGTGGYNRQVTLATSNYSADPVCFNQCGICTPPVTLTLSVDMSQQTVAATGVHVGGTFNNWNSSATVMTNSGGNIYTATVSVPGESVQEYKFINGDTWTNTEIVPSSCGVPDGNNGYNRQVTLAAVNFSADLVCFSQCGTCVPPVNLTLSVDMSQQTIAATGIHVGGTFNSWNSSATLMTNSGNNVYTAIVSVPSGSVQEYKFINGDIWAETEIVPASCGVPDGNNGFNRQVTLGSGNHITDLVCFSQCGLCGAPVNLTLSVDMSQITIASTGVHVGGTFNSWNSATSLMTNSGNNIYTATVSVPGGSIQEYKFINGDTWTETETVPLECGVPDGTGGYNRQVTLGSSNQATDVVCFSQCGPCPLTYNAIFSIDMSHQTVSANGVHITGNFQGWNPGSTEMTLAGNGIYEYTTQILESENVEYRFINGNNWAGEENVPEACGVANGSGGFNRFYTMPAGDTTLPAYCFSSCDPCPPVNPVNVTFMVDMSLETVSSDGVHLAGTFQGWDPAATIMTNIGNNVYSKSVLIDAGVQVQYKFINGITWENVETVPETCGVPDGQNGFNRFITVPDSDTTIASVCFSSCSICNVGIGSATATGLVSIYPNPASDIVDIVLNTNNASPFISELYNTDGEKVYSYRTEILKPGQTVISLSLRQLPEGLYFFILRNGNGNAVVFSQKLIIR
jgi:1,4-alpha-glucan branching enzyme